jgi:hypothetical protein
MAPVVGVWTFERVMAKTEPGDIIRMHLFGVIRIDVQRGEPETLGDSSAGKK